MSYDALIMYRVSLEMQDAIAGATVQRVYEPDRSEIILQLYNKGTLSFLLISINANYARMHLTENKKQGLKTPSSFCMLLRKYLIGGKAVSFQTMLPERVTVISFSPPDGLQAVKLICEIMGRRSNLILVDSDNYILGAARMTPSERNIKRAIMVGNEYPPVPKPDKLNPLVMSRTDFSTCFQNNYIEKQIPEKALLATVFGLSPQMVREVITRAGESDFAKEENIAKLYKEVTYLFQAGYNNNLTPVIIPDIKDYAPVRLKHLGDLIQHEVKNINQMLDSYYKELVSTQKEAGLREQLGSIVRKRITTLSKKREDQLNDYKATEDANLYKTYGEQLLVYGSMVKKGDDNVCLPDMHNPDQNILVPLEPSLSVKENTTKYFNRYRKAKKGKAEIKKQLRKTDLELSYCHSLLYSINNSDLDSLHEITEELKEAGLLRKKKLDKDKKSPPPQPLIFKSSTGNRILVGRNNRQNDHITFSVGKKRDTWFHAKDLPGSHVVIKDTSYPPCEEDIREAAFLAAFFSRGREQKVLTVDYTEMRHVRRKPGGKPGAVLYENYESVSVNPTEKNMIDFFKLE